MKGFNGKFLRVNLTSGRISVEEPSEDETIQILRGIRPAYEAHHRLNILDEALDAATSLSIRYVSDRFLPDKAIDLIDESASRVRMYKSPAAETTKEIIAELREVRKQYADATESGDDNEASELMERQDELEEKLDAIRNTWDRDASPNVTAEDIAEEIADARKHAFHIRDEPPEHATEVGDAVEADPALRSAAIIG